MLALSSLTALTGTAVAAEAAVVWHTSIITLLLLVVVTQ